MQNLDPGAPADPQQNALAPEQCAIVELDPNAKPQPGPEAQQLTLAKNPVAAQCSDVGGGCSFMISITNPGPNEFNGPLSFTDHVSQPDGSPFPNITLENVPQANSVEGVTAPVFCKKDGNDVNCASAVPAKIPAGKTIQILMTFKPGSGSLATAIKNCASFAGGEKQCANIPLVKGPLLRAQKFTAAQTCVPECAFAIVLQNVGNSDAQGPFVLSEEFTPMGPGVTVSVIDGDFACNQIGGKVGCISTNKKTDVLKPGEITNGRILVKGAALSPKYTNCVNYDPNAQAKPSPFDNETPGRCVTITEKTPVRPSLRISKLLSDPKDPAHPESGTCKIDGPCRFRVTVLNESDVDYAGPITINDEIPAKDTVGKPQAQPAGIENFADPDWTCTKTSTRAISCSNKKQAIPAHQSVTLNVIGTPGPGWKKNDGFQNCATLTVSDQAFGTGRQSCAQYILDPFNVKVSKTGDQACAPGGECHFTLTLFNPGPIDHNAPVTISDNLSGLSSAQIVSINPPLPCATQPTQVPFSCTSPGAVSLPLGGTPMVFNMVVRLPDDASARQFSNCASVSDETRSAELESSCATVETKPAPVPVNAVSISKRALSSGCDETSPCTFEVTFSNSSAQDIAGPFSFFDVMSAGNQAMTQLRLAQAPASPWTCIASAGPGMECSHPGPLPANGSLSVTLAMQPLAGSLNDASQVTNCASYRATRREPACVTLPVYRRPPPSQPLPAVPPLPPTQCFGDMILVAGLCQCPNGTQFIGGRCVSVGSGNAYPSRPIPERPQCPDYRPVGTYPDCCPVGTEFRNGACRRPREEGGSNGTRPDTDQRVCPPDRPIGIYPYCCPEGTVFRNGVCRRPREGGSTGPTCPRSRPVGVYPYCCPEGTEFRNGECRRPREGGGSNGSQPGGSPTCPRSRPVGVYPYCCPEGTEFRNGECRRPREGGGSNGSQPGGSPTCPRSRPVGVYPYCCPEGTEFRNGECRRPRDGGGSNGSQPGGSPTCPRSRPVGVYPYCCPEGTEFRNGECRRPRDGGGSNGTQPGGSPTCPRSRPVGVYPNCCPEGTEFRGGRCRRLRDGDGSNGTQPGEGPYTKTCPDGTKVIGRYTQCPNDKPKVRTCPPGYRVLDKPNKYGAYCEIIPQPTTPAQPQPTPGRECGRGMIGRYPVCHCPAGQAMYAGRCRPQRPQPTGPTPSKVPADNCHYEDKCVKYKPNPGQIAPLCVETQKVKVCGSASGPK